MSTEDTSAKDDTTQTDIDDAADKVVDALKPEAEKQEEAEKEVTDAIDDAIEADNKLQEEGAKEIEKATKGMSDEDVNRVADAVYAKLHPDTPVIETDIVDDDAETPEGEGAGGATDDVVEPDEPPKNEHWYFRKRGGND